MSVPASRATRVWWVWVLALAGACSDGSDPGGGDGDAAGAGDADGAESGPDDGGQDEEGEGPDVVEEPGGLDAPADLNDADAPEAPPFERIYTTAADFPAPVGGGVWRRAIIHLHSTHSHDACDGEPRVEGEYNLPCLESLRAALCTDRIDFAFLTDHRDLMAETPFEDLLLHDDGDALIEEGGVAVGNRITCPDGFVVTTAAGMEHSDRLMPLALRGHLDPDVGVRSELLGRTDAEAIAALRAGGALIWAAHTEQASAAEIRERGYDGIEIYNLHANLDPDLRELLGLEPTDGLQELLHFQLRQSDTPPDLALLGFVAPNGPALARWAEILLERPLVGTAGSDAHENVLATPLVDGERFDSYRRVLSWVSNYILAEDAGLEAARAGLLAGRVFVAFDAVADPGGFDCAVVGAGGERLEMGSTAAFEAGLEFRVRVPEIEAPWAEPVPVRTLLLRAEVDGWEEVAEAGAGEVVWELEEAGVYRVEVRVTATHVRPYLHEDVARLGERELVWIYGNAFRIGI